MKIILLKTTYKPAAFFSIALLLCCISGISQPVADFNATIVSGCAPLTVTFKDLSTGNPASWQWDLGNGSTSNKQAPSTSYFNPGTYTVSLKVSNAAGTDSITKTNYIVVNDKPTVNFSASVTSGCFPLPTIFSDLSKSGSGNISNWYWDLGDGDTSSLKDPSHIYTTAGNYSITLKVINDKGCFNVATQIQYIKVANGVTVDFANSPPVQCKAPETINFQNLSTGPASLSYVWDFGDGDTSSLANPAHSYNNGGNYSVKLITKSTAGCMDTALKQNVISIKNYQTNFSGPASVCIGATAVFTNASTPAPISSYWNFGDGTDSTSANASKKWATEGTYSVKLINSYNGCTDSVTKPINVIAPLVANFTSTDSFNCKAPFTTQFKDITVGSTSWSWNFGDGSTSTLQNPSHTYNTTGQFNVSLTVTNAGGCKTTVTKSFYIKIVKPIASITNLPIGGCIPFNYTATATVNDPKGVASYLWDFGDGATSVLQSPSHTYAATGKYTVKLYFTANDGCKDSVIKDSGLKTGTPPVVDFTLANSSPCVGQTIQFNDKSSTVDAWLWNFGDGTTSQSQNPQHAYLKNGQFNVKLTATNNGCAASLTKNNLVQSLPPLAAFTPMFDCISKTQLVFKDSSALPTSWAWDFGDGSTSASQSPLHNYASLGNYNVSLTVQNGGCSNTKTIAIKLVNEHADFTTAKNSVCRNAPVLFTAINSVAANIASYIYDFGDGTIINSTSNNTTHVFTDPGVYTVKLVITDINGCKDSITKTKYITVIGPNANFTASPLTGCKGLVVTFADKSTSDGVHPINNWQWNYGDSIIQTLTSPPFTHSFTSGGSFAVRLKVTDSNGCFDTITSIKPIVITAPIADFTSADTLACAGKMVTFKNTSKGDSLHYIWSFGNGNISSNVNPVTSYALLGSYNVMLSVTDMNGCKDSIEKNNYISIQVPKAGFNVNDSVGHCTPFEVDFTNTSINSANQIWDFGDGSSSRLKNPVHYYSTPGTYIATLYASRSGGCVDSFKRTIVLRSSTAILSYSPLGGCSQINVTFHVTSKGPSNYFWDFGDGNTLSTTDSNAINTYQTAGNYVPKVILTDSTGCQIPVTGKDTIHLTKSTIIFKAVDSAICLGSTVSFINNTFSNKSIIAYKWDFGDESTSSQSSPKHIYAAAGNYTVSLIATTINGCSDTLIKNNYVHVYGPIAAFTASAAKACKDGAAVVFTDNSKTDGIHPIANWQWKYGDGVVENFAADPFSHRYISGGFFTPQLKITDSYGCSDSVVLKNNIFVTAPKASFSSTDTFTCTGKTVSFKNTSTGMNLVYAWSLGNGVATNSFAPTSVYSNDSNYTVQLITADTNGCSDTLIKNNYIKVNAVPKVIITGDTSICASSTLNIAGAWVNVDESTLSWHWDFGNGNTSSLQTPPAQLYNTSGNYAIQLIARSQSGCADTVNATAAIHPLPTTDAGKNANVCLNNNLQLQATGADYYNWSPANYLNCSSCANPVSTPLNSIVYYVKGTTIYGCEKTDSITLTVKKPFKLTVTPATDSLCIGSLVKLSAAGTEEYTWYPSEGLNNANIPNPIAIPGSSTAYKVVGTDNAHCYSDSATVSIAVFPYPTVNAGPDKNLSFGQSATLAPQYSTDVVKWEWSPSANLSCGSCTAPVASPQNSTTYTIAVTNKGGCTAKDEVAVNFPCQVSIFLPNTFSPNNDGMNDYFYPRGKDVYLIQSLSIFDRWGELVFQRTNFPANSSSMGWDGKFKGKPASSDVYTYIVEAVCNNNNVSVFRGDVTLIR